MIEIKALSKYYGAKLILDDINLTIGKGSVIGIVGKNGAGKSTLFKCLSGLENYDGQIISDFKPLKDHIGYLPTIPFYFSKMTGYEYLQLICNARSIDTVSFDQKNIFDLPLNEYAEYYSTGMKKKLALMGLLLQENDLLILDEPFNGVDIESNTIIFELIQAIKAQGKSILISSHIFGSLKDICEEIYLLKDHKISTPYYQDDFTELERSFNQESVGARVHDFFKN